MLQWELAQKGGKVMDIIDGGAVIELVREGGGCSYIVKMNDGFTFVS